MRERLRIIAARLLEALKHLLPLALCLAMGFVLARGMALVRGGSLRAGSVFEPFQHWVSGLQKSKLSAAVETYYWEKGMLPADLDSLVREGYLDRSSLTYPWGESYFYETYSSADETAYYLFEPLR